MFSINIYVKFALIAIFLGGGVVLAFAYGFWYAFPLILIGLTFVAAYLLLGTVQSAAQFIETQEFEKAEQRLNLTLSPKFLYVTNRAYYYILKGSIATQLRRPDEGKEYFKLAEELKLPSDNEKALVKFQLAAIYANNGNWNVAKHYMRQIEKLDVTEKNIKEQIKQLQEALKQTGGRNPQHMRQANQMRGRKRRRMR